MQRPWLLALAVFLCVLPFRAHVSRLNTPPDDAYITYRYAANVADAEGFVYNRGERVLGTTSPLLTLLLAAARLLGLDVALTARCLCTIASAACVALLAAVAWQSGGGPVAAVGGALLLGLSGYEARLGASGMETPLLGSLMLGSVLLLGTKRPAWGAFLAALTALTRPEGFAWWGLYGVYLWREGQLNARVLAAGLLPVAAWLGFATAYFGSPVPHTLVAKHLQGLMEDGGAARVLRDLGGCLGPVRYWLVSLAAVFLALKHDRRLLLPLGFAALFLATYLVGQPMIYTWYAGPLGIALALLLVAVLGATLPLWDAPAQSWRRGSNRLWVLAVLTSFLLLTAWRMGGHGSLLTAQAPVEPRLALAAWLPTHTLPGETILVGDIGYVGYYNLDRRLVDYYGLVWQAPRDIMALAMRRVLTPEWMHAVVVRVAPDWCALGRYETPRQNPPGYVVVPAPELPAWTILRRHR